MCSHTSKSQTWSQDKIFTETFLLSDVSHLNLLLTSTAVAQILQRLLDSLQLSSKNFIHPSGSNSRHIKQHVNTEQVSKVVRRRRGVKYESEWSFQADFSAWFSLSNIRRVGLSWQRTVPVWIQAGSSHRTRFFLWSDSSDLSWTNRSRRRERD